MYPSVLQNLMFSFVTFASLVMRTSVLSSFTVFLISVIFGLDNPPAFRWVIRVFLHVFALKRTFSCSSFLPSYQYCLNYHSFSTTTQEARTALGMLRTQVTFFKTLRRKLNFHWNLTRITVLYMKTDIHFLSHLTQFFFDWEMFQAQVVEKMETHILCWITPPPPNQAVYEIVW